MVYCMPDLSLSFPLRDQTIRIWFIRLPVSGVIDDVAFVDMVLVVVGR